MERVIRLTIALAACLVAIPALAGNETENHNQKLLDVLLEQGAITKQQHEELSKGVAREREAPTPPVSAGAQMPAVSAESEDPTWKAYWKNSFRVERSDGLFKLKFGGRIQADMAGISSTGSLLSEWPDQKGFGGEFRRARVFFEGNVWEHAVFKAQYDFASGERGFKDLYVGLRNLGPVERAWAGHYKEAFSINELTSSKYITFMERALPVEAFAPSRNTGIGIPYQNALNKRMVWSISAFLADTGDGDALFQDTAGYNLTMRTAGTPIYAEEGRRVLHIGLSYSHKFTRDSLRFRARPEAHLSPNRLVDTGNVLTNGADLLGAELAAVYGPFSFQSEFIPVWLHGRSSSGAASDAGFGSNTTHTLWGFYTQASYFLTGENRNYLTKTASFGRVTPRESFSLKKGTWGAWEVGARYSYLNLTDRDLRGGIESDFTLGLNWYLYSNLRLMFNYVYAWADQEGNSNILQARASLDF